LERHHVDDTVGSAFPGLPKNNATILNHRTKETLSVNVVVVVNVRNEIRGVGEAMSCR
jgi:hypothetical protein